MGAVDVEKFAAQFFRRVAVLHALEGEKHRLLRAAAGADMHGDKVLPAPEVRLRKSVKALHIAGDGAQLDFAAHALGLDDLADDEVFVHTRLLAYDKGAALDRPGCLP